LSDIPNTIKDAARALRSGSVTSTALTRALLHRADRIDPLIGANITRMDETALAAAARADAAFAIGVDKGPLQGIPLGLKDILSTDDAPTTGQSLTMDPAWSAQGDGTVVARLRAAGADRGHLG
jgi:aspartyl-tRNA(Asn)/glutamyl-tRNA(Gln) amidotransferase subunit A